MFKKKSYGAARWASFFEQRALINKKNTGFILDGTRALLEELSYQHLLLVAPTGMGKTTKFTMPNLIRQNFEGSMVVIDPSGEAYKLTAPAFKQLGINVEAIAPFTEEPSAFYNPLHNIHSLSDAQIVSDALIEQVKSKGDPIWHQAASSFLSALIYSLAISSNREEALNPSSLIKLVSLNDKDLISLISSLGEKTQNAELIEAFSDFRNIESENTRSGVRFTAATALRVFKNEYIKAITNAHTFDFSDLRKKETVLYLIIPENKIQNVSGFIALFFSQMFNFLNDHASGFPVRVILEEFGNIGIIPKFEQIATTIRKRKVAIAAIVQDLNQIYGLYGKEHGSAIIDGGFVSKLFLPGLGHDTCKRLEDMLGKFTVKSSSYNSKSSSASLTDTAKSLLSASEIRMLQDKYAIFLSSNHKPVLLKDVIPFYKQKDLRGFLLASLPT